MTAGALAIFSLGASSSEGQGNFLIWIPAYLLIFVVFYFLLIAPTRRQQRQRTEMIDNLKPGDKVITNGGIHGTVVSVTDSVIQLRIAERVKIQLSKNAIAAQQSTPGAESDA